MNWVGGGGVAKGVTTAPAVTVCVGNRGGACVSTSYDDSVRVTALAGTSWAWLASMRAQ